MLKTHGIMGKVRKYRKALKKKSLDDGLHYCIDELSLKFMAMRTWYNNLNDPNLFIVKFEDKVDDPTLAFTKIFNFCDIDITDNEIEKILSKYTKKKMREKDLKNRSDKSESHYRASSSKHSDYFNASHYDHFHKITGNLTEVMRYE